MKLSLVLSSALVMIAARGGELLAADELTVTVSHPGALARPVPLRYYAGGGWKQSGDFAARADREAYLAAWSKRLAAPTRVKLAP
jgi:hypothetical protein